MFMFIDESGDSGFEFERCFDDFFVFTVGIFKDFAPCGVARQGLRDLVPQLKCYPEFKVTRISHRFRVEFFRSCLVVDRYS